MTRSLMVRCGWAALLAATTLLLASCGGGGSDSSGSTNLRVLNATNDVTSLDVYLGDSKTASAVVADTPTSYASVSAASYTVKVTSAGDTSTLFSGSYTLSKDLHYTAVVWGRTGSLKLATLPEDDNTDNITSGSGRVRIYNATSDAGSVDVYLTQGVDDLANATPIASSVISASLGGYKELSAGTYRLRITGAGDFSDLRLDVPALTITAKQYSTLIVTAGPGGVLVNSAHLLQQGALTALKNTQARMRVIAGADASGSVTVKVDGVTRQGSLRSPRIGPYILVDAGARLVDVSLNNVSVSSTTQTLTAGGDYTLLTIGTGASGQVQLITDDNRLATSGRYRIRLINAAASIEPATLSVDLKVLVSDIPSGASSSFVTATATTAARLEVTSSSFEVDALTDVKLQSLGVYTVFVLGGGSTPAITPVQDR